MSSAEIPTAFRIEVHRGLSTVRIAAHGELDVGTAKVLRAEAARVGRWGYREIIVDLRALTFIDSAGLHLIESLETDPDTIPSVAFMTAPGPVTDMLRFAGRSPRSPRGGGPQAAAARRRARRAAPPGAPAL